MACHIQPALRHVPAPFYFGPRTYQQEVLQAIYEAPELLNENLLGFEYPLYVADDEELDYFLGSLVKSATRIVHDVGKRVEGVAKTVGKGISAVDKVVPMSVLTSTLNYSPLGLAVRAGLGAAQAAAEGRNVFQGAVRSLARDPAMRFAVDTGMAAARGENVLKAAQRAAQAGISDVRKSLQFAAMVAPFVPGIGTGLGAALGAANALAAGQPITDALIAAARGAVPGGAIAQFAFDTAMDMAKGKNIGDALLQSARSQLPGGPVAQAAFDAAVALARGRNIQDAAFAAAGRLLPPSPYAADALSFIKKVTAGQNIQRAALSTVGNAIYDKIREQAGPLVPRIPAQIPTRMPRLPLRRPFREIEALPAFEGLRVFIDPSWAPIEKAFGQAMSFEKRSSLYNANSTTLDDYAADFEPKARSRKNYYFHPTEAPLSLKPSARTTYAEPYTNTRATRPALDRAAVRADDTLQQYRWFQ